MLAYVWYLVDLLEWFQSNSTLNGTGLDRLSIPVPSLNHIDIMNALASVFNITEAL